MRVSHVFVRGLFGIFNHEIPLNSSEHITIIHGPNGLGKTVLLTMIRSLLGGRYESFRRIPFREFGVQFDDGSNLLLKKQLGSAKGKDLEKDKPDELVVEFQRQGAKPELYQVSPAGAIKLPFPLDVVEHVAPGLERVTATTWLFAPTQEILSLEEVVERFGESFPQVERRLPIREPEGLETIRKSINVRFIETQRLLTYSRARKPREYEDRASMVPAVGNYSSELASMIQAKLAEYATLSQSLDRSFPNRLVKGTLAPHPSIEQLRIDLNALEEKRARLEVAGLLDKEQIDFREFLNIDSSNSYVLSVYIDDVKNKLTVFDELTNKIDLLVKIVNSRFLYKAMSISKKDGFVFKSPNGKHVPTANLSSGEQHELVLFYELLFKVTPNSLILIDEPELSLHVVWQQLFLKDLDEITKLTGFDILIATHSPQIIHDRWDLTVELKGPQDA